MSGEIAKEETRAVWKEIVSESDRGCVLLSGARLDRLLERILRLKFLALSGADDKEIDGVLSHRSAKASLVGFASRARIARLLGLIDKETCNSLKRFAIIRNDYAHNNTVPILTPSTMQPVIDAMPPYYRQAVPEHAMHLKDNPASLVRHLSDGRRQLLATVTTLDTLLTVSLNRITESLKKSDQTPQSPEPPEEKA